jgi:hypothetical protein
VRQSPSIIQSLMASTSGYGLSHSDGGKHVQYA